MAVISGSGVAILVGSVVGVGVSMAVDCCSR